MEGHKAAGGPDMRDDDLVALLAEIRAEHRRPSAEDYAWADRVLNLV